MAAEFTDAIVQRVNVNVRDSKGRRASLSFENDGVLFHNRRPKQGKKSLVSYDRLLDLALEGNGDFFKPAKRRGSGR